MPKKQNSSTPMRYGQSLRYGGVMIDAHDCDYDLLGTKNLQIICPNCHGQIYLSKGGDRRASTRTMRNKDGTTKTVKVKGSTIPPHFCHYHETDIAKLQQCELRSSKITRQEIEKTKRSARGQRERFFKNHFWQALKFSHLMVYCDEDIKFAKYGLNQFMGEQKAKGFLVYIAQNMLGNSANLQQIIQDLLHYEIVPTIKNKPEFLAKLNPSICSFLQNWNSSLEERMQIEICQEAIQFLFNKRNQDILLDLILIGIAKTILETIDLERQPSLFVTEQPVLQSYTTKQWERSQPVESLWDSSKSREYLQLNPSVARKHFQNLITFFITKQNQSEVVYNMIVNSILNIIAFCPWSEAYSQLQLKQSSDNNNYLKQLSSSGSVGFHHYSAHTGQLNFIPFSDPIFGEFINLFDQQDLKEFNQATFDLGKLNIFANTIANYQVKIQIIPSLEVIYFDICMVDDERNSINLINNGVSRSPKGRSQLNQRFTVLSNNYQGQVKDKLSTYADFQLPKKLPILVSLICPEAAKIPQEDLRNVIVKFARIEQAFGGLLLQYAYPN